ncbi:MAG: universal stress protein [Solirubrobacteraceae bacterium]
MFSRVLVGDDERSGGRDAAALAAQLGSRGGRITPTHVDHGDVARTLHELVETQDVDLLVVGSCRRGNAGRVLVGNDTRACMNGAPCAVAIAPRGYAEQPPRMATIGVGYDGSEQSELALAAARDIAARHQARIRALSVVSLHRVPAGEPVPADWPEQAQRLIEEDLARLRSFEGVEGDAVYGEPSDELARFGERVDLLIVGSRAHGPLGRLLNGSTSNYLERHAPCPLLVMPRGAKPGRRAQAGEENHTVEVG